jgi:predicted ATPase
MITRLEALRFKSLRSLSQPLRRFNVLVGANASGKSSFLDAIQFIADVVREGPGAAIVKRTDNFMDLAWQRAGDFIELAIEVRIPEQIIARGKTPDYDQLRYELQVGFLDQKNGQAREYGILGERLFLMTSARPRESVYRRLFPEIQPDIKVFSSARSQRGFRRVVAKATNDNFYSEVEGNKGKGWIPAFRFGPHKSALGNLPDDGRRFPAATWLRSFLAEGIQEIALNGRKIRESSPPGQGSRFLPDGSNLPWVVDELRQIRPQAFRDWVRHSQVAFPEIQSIEVGTREDTRHKYLIVDYRGNLQAPSWVVSDGTLRFLALTLLAYLGKPDSVSLIEEPENGIHPKAIEFLFESLSSEQAGQVLLATHSPIALKSVRSDDILCFAKKDGATDVVRGGDHPALRDWKDDGTLDGLFASGLLG